MDDLVAALLILAQKLRVDVNELSANFVSYTRISAIVQFIVYMICGYVAYCVVDYIYKQYLKANPMRLVEAHLPPSGAVTRARKEEEHKALVELQASGAKIARVVLIALIMGSFFITALCQLPTIISPEGAALELVMETLKDATRVEIVQPEPRASRMQEKGSKT